MKSFKLPRVFGKPRLGVFTTRLAALATGACLLLSASQAEAYSFSRDDLDRGNIAVRIGPSCFLQGPGRVGVGGSFPMQQIGVSALISGGTIGGNGYFAQANSAFAINAAASKPIIDSEVTTPAVPSVIETGCAVTDFEVVEETLPTVGTEWRDATLFRIVFRWTEGTTRFTGTVLKEDRGARDFWTVTKVGAPIVDTTPPTPVVSSTASDFDGIIPFDVTIDFGEPLDPTDTFERTDLTITNGTATLANGTFSPVVDNGNGSYTVTVRSDGTGGPISVSVGATVAADLAGNANLASNTATFIDTTPPVVIFLNAPPNFTTLSEFSFYVEFNEIVTNFDPLATNLGITGGSIVRIEPQDDNLYRVFVEPDGTSDVVVSVPTGAAQDVAGNDNVASGSATVLNLVAVDAPPTPVVSSLTTVYTGTTPFLATIDFEVLMDEFFDPFELSDLIVTNASASALTDNLDGTFTVTITPDGAGDIELSVPAFVASDATFFNPNLASNVLVISPLDSTAPTPTVSADAGTPATITGLTPFTVEVTFDEDINDFDDLADVTVTNGSVDSIVPTGTPNVFTVSITPDGNGDVGVTVPVNVATDDAGNDNVASNTLTIGLDTTAPTPTVSADAGTPATITGLTPFTVEVTFDEDINDFDDLADVTVTNGSVDSIVPSGTPNTFTITITPTTNDDVSISVPAAVATDDAGNDNVVSNTLVVANAIDETATALVEEVLNDDLLVTTRMIAQNASNVSRRAANRLRFDRGQACVAEINDLLRTSPVRFASGSFFIDASNNQLLNDIALALSNCETASFMIAGHTDSDASDAYNLTLSQNRVDGVKAALVRRGIASTRLQTRGFGESRPIATNATEEGQAQNRRVEFILLDGGPATELACGNGNGFGGDLNADSNDAGSTLFGSFGSDGHNCATGEYTETWGEIDVVRNDATGTQGMASFGISKERQVGNRLRGRFIEGYVSRRDVDTDDVDGTITGVGLHAGLFGARASGNGLVFSYYGSAAIGRHEFDLNAGTDVDGSYTYAGLFAGGAVTGEMAMESVTVKPRAGVDLGFSQSIGSEISTTGSLDIDPATYARAFVELGLAENAADNAGAWEVAPRVFCETNDDSDADACGFGGRVSYEGAMSAEGTQWNAEFDYETLGERDQMSFGVARTQSFSNFGVSKTSFGASENGALEIAQTLEFNW